MNLEMKHIFLTMVSHEGSFCHRGKWQLEMDYCKKRNSRLTNTYAVDVLGKPIPFAAVQRYLPSFVLFVMTSLSLFSADRITDWLPSVVQVTFGAGFPDVRHVSVMTSL